MPIGDDSSQQKQSECLQLFSGVITQKINRRPQGNALSCSISGLLQSVVWLGLKFAKTVLPLRYTTMVFCH